MGPHFIRQYYRTPRWLQFRAPVPFGLKKFASMRQQRAVSSGSSPFSDSPWFRRGEVAGRCSPDALYVD
jgi:hypothetical protein